MFNRARLKPRVRGARSNVIPPPLDGLPDAGAAYGPRKMRSAYTGPAMRVRRADNAELDIGFATTPQTRTNLMPVPLVDNAPAVPGITTTQVGSGTEFGQPYIDIRWQGTATAAGALVFRQGAGATYNPAVHAAVTPGLVYTASVGYRFIAGTVPSQTLTIRLIQRAANAAGLSFGSVYIVPAPTAAMQRAVAMDVIIPGVVYAHAQIGYNIAINDVLDVTLRFYANNLELGIGNIRPLLQRNVPEIVAGVGDLDTDNLMRFVAQDNLFQRSQQFDDAYWTKAGGAVTADAAMAPDGTMTADVFTEDSAAATQHRKTRASLSLTTGQTVTLSVFVKRDVGTRQYQLGLSGGTQVARAYFDLGAGAVGAVDQCTAAIEPAPGGYWRVSITVLVPSGTTYTTFLAMANGLTVGSETYTGDGVSSVAEWGAQLNNGPLAPYNATTSAGIALAPAQSGFVAVWYDQTGNARHLTQTTAANQPSGLIAGAVVTENGRAILSCDGVNDVLSSAAGVANAVMGGKPFTATHITFGSNAQFGWTGNGPNGVASVPRLYFQRNAYAYNNNGTVTVGAASGGRVLSYTHDGVTTASARRDGVLMGTGTEPVIPTFGGGGYLSVPLFAAGVAQAGGFSEFVAFSQLLTTDQLQQLERNIGAYYGVTVS